MKPFQVLDRNQRIHQNYLLEASAGTGKTYSIENIVVRLLLDPAPGFDEPLPLEAILVVTFTRAATRDLKKRIRENLVKVLAQLSDDSPPDYLQSILERLGLKAAKKRLEHALFCFDQAQIFTIHGFCNRMLKDHVFEGGISLAAIGGEGNLSKKTLQLAVHDFFRTGMREDRCSHAQFEIVLRKHRQDFDSFKEQLLKTVLQGKEIECPPPYQDYLEQFRALRKTFFWDPEKLMADYDAAKEVYKTTDREKVGRFAELGALSEWGGDELDLLILEGVAYVNARGADNKKKEGKTPVKPPVLHYPQLVQELEERLCPLVKKAANLHLIFALLAHDCREHVKHFMDQEELLGHDDLLEAMREAVLKESFAEKVRSKYKAAIIDEFQDTDPVQWDIFSRLFLSKNEGEHFLYLVGDPKQSIYAFRHADIYTYLEASRALGERAHASLDTNYRSRPELVQALNLLFESAEDFIHLPRLSETLPYRPVKAGIEAEANAFNDSIGWVHFFQAVTEEDQWNYVAGEIRRLMVEQGMPPKKFAILVKDRRQAQDLLEVLQNWKIPALNQRQMPIAETATLPAFRELVEAVAIPGKLGNVKKALGGILIGWDLGQVQALDDHETLEAMLLKFYELRTVWSRQGFCAFFDALLNTGFSNEKETLAQLLVGREGGAELYQDLHQLVELFLHESNRHSFEPESFIAFLDELQLECAEEENSPKRRPDPDRDTVKVLTIHSSKGLEFDIVFALGLSKANPEPDYLIPDPSGRKLIPAEDSQDQNYQKHVKELNAEKMRQLYVAMTRAKTRLYLPILKEEKKKKEKIGSESPMDLFLEKLVQPLEVLIEKGKGVMTSALVDSGLLPQDLPVPAFNPLVPPPEVHIPHRSLYLYSYSMLAKNAVKHRAREKSATPPSDFDADVRSIHTLPSGRDLGILLHKLLQLIPFEQARNYESVLQWTAPFIKSSSFEGWEAPLAELVYNALNTPLPLASGPVSLIEIPADKMYKEAEFLFPWDAEVEVPGMESSEGFLKGVVDLAFEHKGLYYLLDWKSNWLGGECVDYSRSGMEEAMLENGYFLQAHIYREAWRRYIGLIDQRPFEEVYGGMFYIFLRGLDPLNFADTGIYTV